MYCKMCGNLLNDNDKICKKCNAVVEGKDAEDNSQEEIIYNPSFEDIDEEAKEATESIADSGTLQQEGWVWNVHDFSKTQKKTEEASFNWHIEPVVGSEADIKYDSPDVKLFREIREDGERIKAEQLDKIFAFSKKNEKFQELLDKEYERIKNRSILHKEPETKVPAETAPALAEGMNSQIQEMAAARESYFAAKVQPAPESTEEETTDPTALELTVEPDQTALELTVEPVHTAPDLTVEPIQADSDSVPVPPEIKSIPDSNNVTSEDEETVPPTQHAENDDTKGKKGGAGKVLLIIVAIILAIEIIILGIRYFAPDSTAAGHITNAQNKAASWVVLIKDKVSGGSEDQDKGTIPDNSKDQANSGSKEDTNKNNQSGDKPPVKATGTTVPDPKPAADKNALILSQIGYNTNIRKVTANESLAYDPNRDYGLTDINHSKTIDNNIWINENGKEPIYYDASIVGTIIDFDSKWIDYVNGNSNKVFELLKPDSKAYRNAVGFSKVGKVKETFNLLEIGEIRQGSKGFYLWVHEEIQIEEKGGIQNKKYNWIYYLEPVNGQMKIVNYYKY